MFVTGLKTEFSGNRRVDVSNSHQVTSDEPLSQYLKELHGQVRKEPVVSTNWSSFLFGNHFKPCLYDDTCSCV